MQRNNIFIKLLSNQPLKLTEFKHQLRELNETNKYQKMIFFLRKKKPVVWTRKRCQDVNSKKNIACLDKTVQWTTKSHEYTCQVEDRFHIITCTNAYEFYCPF